MSARLSDEEALSVMVSAGLDPLRPYPGALSPWECRCLRCGRTVRPTLSNVRQGRRCEYCSGKRVDPAEAEAFMIGRGLQPLVKFPGSKPPWSCQCLKCGNQVSPRYRAIVAGGGCKYCAGIVADAVERDEVMRRSGLEPLEEYPGALKPWRCRCTVCQHEVSPRFTAVKRGGGCAYCAKRRIDSKDAIKLMRDRRLEPLEDYRTVGAPWRCRCLVCKREVSPSYSSVVGGGGCEYCSGTRVDKAEAAVLMVDNGLQPLEEYPGASVPWRCQCLRNGHKVSPSYSAIRGGGGCVRCAGLRVDPADAERFMRQHGLVPLEPYPGSTTPWLCRCDTCHSEVSPRYTNVRSGRGCSSCSMRGFNSTAPGIIYLLLHLERRAAKVGISTKLAKASRIDSHVRRGWTYLYDWSTPTGRQAQIIEQNILDWWEDAMGSMPFFAQDDMPEGGYTETASLDIIDIGLTGERIEQLVRSLSEESPPPIANLP